jgi:hypothetical protein
VGVSPGTSITGAYDFADGGKIQSEPSEFAVSVGAAYKKAMKEAAIPMEIEMGNLTFLPGTYRSGSAINFAFGTVVTLDGNDEINPVFLFQAGSTLTTAANTYFILTKGAKAENVLWVLGTAATIGANSTVEGSILAGTAITFGSKSALHGCALAQSAVTFESEGYIQMNHYIDDGPGNARAGLARRLRGLYVWIELWWFGRRFASLSLWQKSSMFFDISSERDVDVDSSQHAGNNNVCYYMWII